LANIRSVFQTVFLAKGAIANAKDNKGKGLLHVLSKRIQTGHPFGVSNRENIKEIFQMLVDQGLDPWEEDLRQMTPLDVAAVCGDEEVLAMFRRDK
jgi:hypothetical protein